MSNKERSTIDYSKRTFLQNLIRKLLRLLFGIMTRLQVDGLENMPVTGPVIVVINHINFIDVPLGLVVIPRRIVIFSKVKWKRVVFTRLFLNITANAIFTDSTSSVSAIQQAIKVLRSNGVIGIAPEGTRRGIQGLGKGNVGAAYLSIKTSAPIVPMAMFGQENTGSYIKRMKRVPIQVRIGKPFKFQTSEKGHTNLDEYTDVVMKKLAELLPEKYQGIYKD